MAQVLARKKLTPMHLRPSPSAHIGLPTTLPSRMSPILIRHDLPSRLLGPSKEDYLDQWRHKTYHSSWQSHQAHQTGQWRSMDNFINISRSVVSLKVLIGGLSDISGASAYPYSIRASIPSIPRWPWQQRYEVQHREAPNDLPDMLHQDFPKTLSNRHTSSHDRKINVTCQTMKTQRPIWRHLPPTPVY
jgi:hypothetical protein